MKIYVGEYADGNELIYIGAGVYISCLVERDTNNFEAWFTINGQVYYVSHFTHRKMCGNIAELYWSGSLEPYCIRASL